MILKVFRIISQCLNVTVVLALLSIQFVLKESSFHASLLFYLFPLPIIVCIVLALSVFLTKKWRRYNVIIALFLSIIWLGRSFKIHIPKAIKETDLEVVFWNASRDNGFEEAFKENNGIPDVLVLAESKVNNIKELQSKYPSYYFYKAERELFVFSKTVLKIEKEEASKNHSTVINFTTRGVNFYAIDVQGNPDVSRETELRFMDSVIRKKEQTIILGDFNAPFESKYLNMLKENFKHAFNEKGNGFRETWFWNLPLLSLDHIWVSKDFKILKTQKIYTFRSDHSMLKTYIER